MKSKGARTIFNYLSVSLLTLLSLFYFPGCSVNQGFIWGPLEGPRSEAGLSRFFSSIRPSPGNPDSHYLLAGYYQERGRHREAIAEFKKVLAIDPRHVKAYNGLGVSFDLLGDFAGAIQSYEAALALDPGQAYLHNNLGYSHLMQGNFDRAIQAFRRAIALSPKQARFHNNLAAAYAEKGLFELALEEFRLAGDDARAQFNMAEIYLQKGKYAEARNHYAAALRLNPSYTLAQTGVKAAETLAGIFGKSQGKTNSQTGLLIPEPPKVEAAIGPGGGVPSTAPQAETVRSEENISRPAESTRLEGPESPASLASLPIIPLERLNSNREASVTPEAPKPPPQPQGQPSISGNGAEDWDHEMKIALLSGKAVPIVPASPAKTSQPIPAKKPEPGRNGGIEVSNGNGVNQMAKQVSLYLEKKGYRVDRLTNSQPFNHGHTRVYYQAGKGALALQVADQLPVYYDLVELKKMERPSIQVKVVLGKDLIPHHKIFKQKEGS